MVVEIRLINSGKYLLRRDIKHLSGVLEIYYLDLNGGYTNLFVLIHQDSVLKIH